MNTKKRIFILALLLITGSSAFLFAKAKLDKKTRYAVSARRGVVTANPQIPTQGRIVLTQVNSLVTHFPIRGESSTVDARDFVANWPEFDPKGSMTFKIDHKEMHFDLVLSKPYYDRARQLMSFDVQAKTSLTPYHNIYDVDLYIQE